MQLLVGDGCGSVQACCGLGDQPRGHFPAFQRQGKARPSMKAVEEVVGMVRESTQPPGTEVEKNGVAGGGWCGRPVKAEAWHCVQLPCGGPAGLGWLSGVIQVADMGFLMEAPYVCTSKLCVCPTA